MVAWGRRATVTFLSLGGLAQLLYLIDMISINILTVLGLLTLTEKTMLWLIPDDQATRAMEMWDKMEEILKAFWKSMKNMMVKIGLISSKDDGNDTAIFLIEEGNYINHM